MIDIFNELSEEQKYDVIYADPPWQYKVWSKKGIGRSAENHYKTMEIAELQKLPITNFAKNDSVLFLWVTFPTLQQAFQLIKEWGYTYKTCAFTWIKTNKKQKDTLFMGLGHWTRSNAELCLLCTKGKKFPKKISSSIRQIVETENDTLLSPIRKHSQKPNEVRTRIVELLGEEPKKIELFAREKISGWDCWGNDENIK